NPGDYDLIPKKKESLPGILYRIVLEILKALDRSIRAINRTVAALGIL
ncbi:hypothetical protein AVEN_100771-1, partial [Araneus ventricosus]